MNIKQKAILDHISYEKISSDFKKYKLTKANYRLFKKTDWVVTEKIHGANFCILTDGNIVNFAKRKGILNPTEDFFGYQTLVPQLKSKALAIFVKVKNLYPQTKRIAIYGELFGGEYPHVDVKENLNVNALQTGVYYSPNIEFIAFDIAYINTQQERHYLDCNRAIALCQLANLQHIPVLFQGKYEDAIAYNPHFTTTIPSLLGLPPLNIDNPAEGIVIKPAHNFFVETIKGKLRPVLKIKIPQFAEDQRFHQAQKWSYQDYKKIEQLPESSEQFLEGEVLALITFNRFNNLISKIGKPNKISKKKREHILKLYVQDVIEDLQDNLDLVFTNLDHEQQDKITNLIKQKTEIFFKKY